MPDEILQCSIDDFLHHYAPWQVPTALIHDVYKLYVDDNQRNLPLVKVDQDHEITEQNGWVFAYFEPEPTDNTSPEAKVFKHLKEIVDSLHEKEVKEKLVHANRTPTFFYRDAPYKSTISEISGTDFRADAYLTDSVSGDTVDLAGVAVTAEFKKHVKDAVQNRHQLIAGVSQILNNDPRRTWAYGFTVENTMMSIWYFSRSHTVVSTPFDFTKDIKCFIRVFLSLTYATRAEIGYDPTIHRVVHDGAIHYVYGVQANGKTRYFRTKELCISERKTWVAKAVEVEGYEDGEFGREKNGKEVALKDYWLDEGSRSEKAILDDIFYRLEQVKGNPGALDWITDDSTRKNFRDLLTGGAYKEYFMGIECDMTLATTKSRLPSAKPVPDFLDNEPRPEREPRERPVKSVEIKDLFVNMAVRLGKDKPRNLTPEHRTKRHHRLVYEQVGCPLHAATNLHSSIQGLYHTLVALTLLYLARYVHRDVSTGSIVLVEGPNGIAGKLSGLEYAKIFGESEPSPDPKTGTSLFMAYEIHARTRLYIPRHRSCHGNSKRKNQGSQPSLLWTPKFRFSHDLESLFWVALFILAICVPRENRLSREFVYDVFVAQSRPSWEWERRHVLTMDGFPTFLKERINIDVPDFAEHLADYRSILLWSYTDRKCVENMLDPGTYGLVCDTALSAFQGFLRAIKSLPNIEFAMDTDQTDPQPEIPGKQPPIEEERDDDCISSQSDVSTESLPSGRPSKRRRTDSAWSHVIIS